MVNVRLELKFNRLINEYKIVRDAMIELDESYFDPMSYDISGYEESYLEYAEDDDEVRNILSDLEKQVEAATEMAKGMSKLKYIYG